MLITAARIETPESRAFQRDEQNRAKHAKGALKAYRALVATLAPVAAKAKADFPADKDPKNIDRQAKQFVKDIVALPQVQKFLDTWIGPDDVDPAAPAWRKGTIYSLRNHLIREAPLKEVLKVVGRYALTSFQAITMHSAQRPLREALPSEVMAYLPRNVVVEVDPGGKITRVTDRFKNEFFTLEKKAEHLRHILKNYNSIAKTVKDDLKSPDEFTRLSALVTSIIMETGIRPGKIGNGVVELVDGKKEFVETFGAATLGPGHIKFVRDNFAQIEFIGKMGSVNTATLSDASILKVLKDYVAKALKRGTQYVFVTKAGVPYDYKDLERYFAQKFNGINPTDFRKLRATQEVLNTIIEEQATLYQRLRKLGEMKKDTLKQDIVTEITATLQRAIERSQGALSHDDPSVTIDSYIYPGVLFKFLSTGRLDNNLSDLLASGKTELKFDPESFLRAAMEAKDVPSALRVAALAQLVMGR